MVTVLDSFEDGDISEYSGDTANYSVQSSVAYDGTYGLQLDAIDKRVIDRHDVSISPGETPFGVWMYVGSSTYGGDDYGWPFKFFFAKVEGEDSGYAVWADYDGVRIERYETGTINNIAEDTSVSISTGTWVEVRMTQWNSSGDMTAEFYHTDGTQITTISTTDSTYGSNGIGFVSESAPGISYDIHPKADYIYKPAPVPTAPSDLNATVQ